MTNIKIARSMLKGASIAALLLAEHLSAANPTPFATLSHPNGLAATQDKLLATSQDDSIIRQIDSTGAVTTFATLPAGVVIRQEIYLAVSPGLGGFQALGVYACRGNKVFKVSPDGLTVTTFHDYSPAADALHCGIAFDEVGTFQNLLIVTLQDGTVHKLDSSGNDTLIAGPPTLFDDKTEGPQVAPATFMPAPGQLLVTQEDQNLVWKINGSGVATVLTGTIVFPESNHVVPQSVCSFGTSGGAFFSTGEENNTIYKYPVSDFTGLGDDVLIPLEGFPSPNPQGIDIVDKTTGAITQFDSLGVVHEGSTFVDCVVPPVNADGRMTGGGSVFETDGTRVTHGFELHCDVADVPNRLEINWAGGNNFHLETLVSAFCFTDPNIDSGHPKAPFNTYIGTGTGDLNNVPGATANWTFTDAGEPGTNDHATITIKDNLGKVVLTVSNFLDSGNQQAHTDNK
ncbi:MAG TPA: hypothetical protein VEV17_02435 [Bryobacteraceae bacterium]|nr:hypothetical protein [Bryobacteraceae bacterium]